MSSEDKESGATWQDPVHSRWDQSFDQAQSAQSRQLVGQTDQDELPPLLDQQNEDALHLDAPAAAEESDPDDASGATSARVELLGQLGQYLSLIIVPLLFGGFTCLFVLPLVATGRAQLPPAGLWPITFVIIIIAVAQGIVVYYAGANNGMWALGTVGGFFLFLLVGCFTIFGILPGFVLLAVLAIASIVLIVLYVHPVPEGYVDLVSSFGKYSRTLYPGFNILLPWEKVTHELNVTEIQWTCPKQWIQMSRTEDVELQATISYQLLREDAYLAALLVKDWEESLQELFVITLQDIIKKVSPDTLISWQHGLRSRPSINGRPNSAGDGVVQWERVNDDLFQQMQDRVAPWGVQVNWARLRDVVLAPHNALIMDADPAASVTTQPVIRKATQAAQTTASLPNAQASSRRSRDMPKPSEQPVSAQAQPSHAAQTPASAQTNAVIPAKVPPPDILIKAYNQIQAGSITEPVTIREVAANFEAIANDPVASQSVPFDAARAALNLKAEAARWEERHKKDNRDTFHDDATRTDWLHGRAVAADDDDFAFGG